MPATKSARFCCRHRQGFGFIWSHIVEPSSVLLRRLHSDKVGASTVQAQGYDFIEALFQCGVSAAAPCQARWQLSWSQSLLSARERAIDHGRIYGRYCQLLCRRHSIHIALIMQGRCLAHDSRRFSKADLQLHQLDRRCWIPGVRVVDILCVEAHSALCVVPVRGGASKALPGQSGCVLGWSKQSRHSDFASTA